MAERLMNIRTEVLEAVTVERQRQATIWGGEHKWGVGDCSSKDVNPLVKLGVLTEECGEVARALLDGSPETLRTELIQVAAVAVAWLEGVE